MKTIMRGLTLAAVLLTGAVTQAELVIDNFSTGIGAQGLTAKASNTGTRVFSRSNNTMSANVAANQYTIDFGTGSIAGRNGTLAENLAATYDFHSTGNSFTNVLKFGFNAVGAGQVYDLVITASDGVNDASYTVAGLTGSGNLAVSGFQFGNGAVLSNVVQLNFQVFALNNVAGSTFGFTTISAVPEPATMSLLGLTAIGGIFAHRRRKNQLAA